MNRAEPHIPGVNPVHRGCPENTNTEILFSSQPKKEKRRAGRTSFKDFVELNVDVRNTTSTVSSEATLANVSIALTAIGFPGRRSCTPSIALEIRGQLFGRDFHMNIAQSCKICCWVRELWL